MQTKEENMKNTEKDLFFYSIKISFKVGNQNNEWFSAQTGIRLLKIWLLKISGGNFGCCKILGCLKFQEFWWNSMTFQNYFNRKNIK